MQIHFIPVEQILVDRANRQRKELRNIPELAESIKKIGVINPPTVDKETMHLVAGERRFEAMKLLGFKEIPCIFRQEMSLYELRLLELDENTKREDLDWKDQAEATAELHRLLMENNPDWTQAQTAERIGIGQRHLTTQLTVAKEVAAGNQQVLAAPGAQQAFNVVQRAKERKLATISAKLGDDIADLTKTEKPKETVRPGEKDMIQGDFLKWAPAYKGRRFDFLHCDFPYGVNMDKSGQANSKTWGTYADSKDIYWELCKCLAENLDKLLFNSAHVMFWFSMKFYTDTVKFFREHTDLIVQDHPLIWLKSDGKGIASDVERRPRNTYETALIMSRGDRKSRKIINNAYAAPTGKADALHISEKPVPVLRHFMEMFVDDSTEMLDPTAGGGTSLRAAESMKAKRVFGIELDKEHAAAAAAALTVERRIAYLASIAKEAGK